MVKKKIRDTIRKNNLINSGEHIVIGLSGGPDSVCLFSVLKGLSAEMGFTIHAVHVNHGFRPGAADEDQRFVEAICREAGVDCRSFSYDCSKIASREGLSAEEAGRKVRYRSFMTVAKELTEQGIPAENVKIAVAQNADDQAETVLLRLLRGTGTDGLAGMAYKRMEQNICVIRPLLDTWRSEIEAYCEEQHLSPRIDHTNKKPIYTRNKIRLQLIPYLEENFNPNIMEALGRLSRTAGEDKAYLWQQAEAAFEQLRVRRDAASEPSEYQPIRQPRAILLDQQGLRGLPRPIKYRVIMKAFQQIGLEQDISSVHLETAERILEASGESRTSEFPGGYKMTVRYGEVAFLEPEENKDAAIAACRQYMLNVRVVDICELDPVDGQCRANNVFGRDLSLNVAELAKSDTDSQNSDTAAFDYDKFKATQADETKIEYRSRREGDFLPMKKGRKKLQNLLIDEKVPKEYRDQVKFAAIGSEILWIPARPEIGIIKNRYSPKYKLDIDTKKALLLELICEI